MSASDITPPEPEVRVPFMQPHTIQVKVTPGKAPVHVVWWQVGPLPEDFTKVDGFPNTLPEGMTQDETNLIIWAASEEHEGVYEGVVIRDSDQQEITRFNVTVRVDPMVPENKVVLPPGKAEELPRKEENVSTVTPKPGVTWDFVVQGFTPDAEYCEYPTWTMVDYQTNTITDVTERG